MINPNKLYRAKGYIRTIDKFKVIVDTKQGGSYSGYVDNIEWNPKRFTEGEPVSVWVQWSIIFDEPMIRRIHKRRSNIVR